LWPATDIVGTFPLTKFEGGLNVLHEAYDDAVIWLESSVEEIIAGNSLSGLKENWIAI